MFGFDYSDIKKNLYDHDMIKYNRFVSKEWKRKADNDEFNLISPPNQIPYQTSKDYFYSSSESEDDNDMEVFSPDSEMIDPINPYKMFNPYIEDDIYNKDNKYIIETIRYLIDSGRDNIRMNDLLYVFVKRLKNSGYNYDEIYDYMVEALINQFSEFDKIIKIKKLINQAIEKSKFDIDKFKEIRKYEKPMNYEKPMMF